MLRKKTTIPADKDLLLPMVFFTYNSSPHEAIGERPFYLLHAFDPSYPATVTPQDELLFNHFDADDYKLELLALLAGIQLAQECSKKVSEKYIEKMKEAYNSRNEVNVQKLPKKGDKVFLKLPREKACKQFPKLSNSWGGPYRVIGVNENFALISNISEEDDPIKISCDALIVVPIEVEHVQLKPKTKRVKRRYATVKTIIFATIHGNGDTASLGLFFRCPGRHELRGSANYSFSCTVHGKRSKDVMPDASETIGKIQFYTIYGLARLISIFVDGFC